MRVAAAGLLLAVGCIGCGDRLVGSRGAAAAPLALQALLGLEQRTRASFVDYVPTYAPVPWAAGDRAWLQVEAPPTAYVYVLGARRQTAFEVLTTSAPVADPRRQVWPEGRIVDHALTAWDTVFVVASLEPLAWVGAAECPGRVGTPPVIPPIAACDHLFALYDEVPPAPRGLVPPTVGSLERPGHRLRAIQVHDTDERLAAVSFAVRPSD